MECCQLDRERRQRAAVSHSHIEGQIPFLYVPRSTEGLAKSVEVAAENAVVRAGVEHANANGLPTLLRLDREGCGK